eukprot:TRINITY_DN610_c0_g2_i4.p2 TRINITY_DN610_c0_g2~~TRINITY_DN610_c0_g2_i4.p2  ORF type:complete len:168 (+),score=30.77 TRINITY_DN610_c0_g2_i4:46-549(+)
MTRDTVSMEMRAVMMLADAFFVGSSCGPLIRFYLVIDQSIITSAFLGTVAVFACFTASALLAKRRSYLYLGGMLSSGLTLLVWMPLLRMLFGVGGVQLELWLGLLVFSGFIVFDTQMIIERSFSGQADPVLDALNLFLDFVNVFIRLVRLIAKLSSNKDSKKSSSRR